MSLINRLKKEVIATQVNYVQVTSLKSLALSHRRIFSYNTSIEFQTAYVTKVHYRKTLRAYQNLNHFITSRYQHPHYPLMISSISII